MINENSKSNLFGMILLILPQFFKWTKSDNIAIIY